MEYNDEELTPEEIELLLRYKRKCMIKKIAIITSIFLTLLVFIIFSVIAYKYNPMSGADEIVVRNDF